MQPGRVFFTEVPMEDFGINRSPAAYLANPASERARYSEDIDRNLQQIKFVNGNDEIVGAFHWVASKEAIQTKRELLKILNVCSVCSSCCVDE